MQHFFDSASLSSPLTAWSQLDSQAMLAIVHWPSAFKELLSCLSQGLGTTFSRSPSYQVLDVILSIKYAHAGLDFPGSSAGKESACNAEDLHSVPELERSLGEGHGNPLQYSCLDNPMDRGAWRATVHGVTRSQTRQWLSTSRIRYREEKLRLFLLLH